MTDVNFVLDVSARHPFVTLVLDLEDDPEVRSNPDVRNLEFVKGQDITLRVNLVKAVNASFPPAFAAVDITGFAGKWTLRKKDVPPDDDLVFSVSGSIISPAKDGIIEFFVPAASFGELLDRAPSQLKFAFNGTEPFDLIENLLVTSKPLLADV